MAPTKTSRDLTGELAFLTRALKAPDAPRRRRPARRTRPRGGLVARGAHGGEGRIRTARFPARKSLEEFDYDHARSLKRETIAPGRSPT